MEREIELDDKLRCGKVNNNAEWAVSKNKGKLT
jgi:hypothetical protein